MLESRSGWGIKCRSSVLSSHRLAGESTIVCQEMKMGSALPFSAKKSLLHMHLTASYQNSPEMIHGSREEVDESVSSLRRERPISQKLEMLLGRLLAMAGYMCCYEKKGWLQLQISCSCTSVNPEQSLLTVYCCEAERWRMFSSSQALNWYLTENKDS